VRNRLVRYRAMTLHSIRNRLIEKGRKGPQNKSKKQFVGLCRRGAHSDYSDQVAMSDITDPELTLNQGTKQAGRL
jgi:hypothetical protein